MSDSVKSPDDKISPLPRLRRYLTLVDENTGKISGHFPLKPKNLGTGWIALYQEAAKWIASQRLTGEQFSVLFRLFGELDFNNYLRISSKEIAEELGMQQANVSRAMKRLKEIGIIVEGPPAGKFKTYRLNPHVAHKGSERKDTIIDFQQFSHNHDDDSYS